MAQKYGVFDEDNWEKDLRRGFDECLRVLKKNGTLIFKWSEVQVTLSEVLRVLDAKPLITHQNNRTFFLVFMKGVE